jgi:hypothetical protein
MKKGLSITFVTCLVIWWTINPPVFLRAEDKKIPEQQVQSIDYLKTKLYNNIHLEDSTYNIAVKSQESIRSQNKVLKKYIK